MKANRILISMILIGLFMGTGGVMVHADTQIYEGNVTDLNDTNTTGNVTHNISFWGKSKSDAPAVVVVDKLEFENAPNTLYFMNGSHIVSRTTVDTTGIDPMLQVIGNSTQGYTIAINTSESLGVGSLIQPYIVIGNGTVGYPIDNTTVFSTQLQNNTQLFMYVKLLRQPVNDIEQFKIALTTPN